MSNYLLLLLLFLSTHTLFAQNRIEVVIPSAEAEAQYVWQTLQDLPFFEQNNYQISLPQGDLMTDLKAKAIKGALSPEDYTAFEAFFTQEVYDPKKYQQGYNQVSKQLPLLEQLIK